MDIFRAGFEFVVFDGRWESIALLALVEEMYGLVFGGGTKTRRRFLTGGLVALRNLTHMRAGALVAG